PAAKITIEGHTDATGKPEANKSLSLKRAEAVKLYLVQNGIEEVRLTAIGFGSEKPLESNKTPEGRAKNRRVEIRLVQ
ncbi:MAG: OmpA family protein, partial [Chitinophagaceae bacterium]|nr:OmpA family protein [Chitinophagaceae bacterium]